MSYLLDPIAIVCFVVFVIVGFRLWQVLGARSGTERPQAPQAAQFETRPLPSDLELKAADPSPRKIWEGYAPEGSSLAKGLIAIGDADPSFETSHFINGAKSAHERILNAFASGDLPTLKLLLSDATFTAFDTEIARRGTAGEQAAFKFVRIKEAAAADATLAGNDATITMRFVSEVVSAVKDKTGKVISGDDKRIAEVNELWTFERHLKSTDAAWKLAETHDGGHDGA